MCVLTVGVLDMSQELGPVAHAMHPAAEQVPGRPHLGRIDIGLGQHATAEQHGDLLGVELIVLGLAPMDRLHGEGVAQDKGKALTGAEVGHPGPR